MGGNDYISTACMAAWKGPVLSEKLPYSYIKEYNKDFSSFENLRYDSDYHLQDALFLPASTGNNDGGSNRDIIKSVLLDYGCLTINYNSSDEYYNNETNSHYCPTEIESDHGVLIVGWDDNYPKENFKEENRPQNDGAWLIQNSWGTSYCDGGYFWLSYEDKSIHYISSFQLEAADNYTKNYQYDITGWNTSISADSFYSSDQASKTAYEANIFTSEGDEQLEAVSFYTTDVDTKYQISVYTDSSAENPCSGKLAYSGRTGYEPYSGYHTIELESPVKLKKDTTFTVVVKLTNPEYVYPVAVSAAITDVKKENLKYSGFGKESFVSADGKNWTDVVDYSSYLDDNSDYSHLIVSNVCIKAFTNPLAPDGEAVSNVRFSLLEGPVALGSELNLEGVQTINYQIDGGAVQTYNGAITIDRPCTITAWGVENGKLGNKVSRTYTAASAQLNELIVDDGSSKSSVEISSDKTGEISVVKPASIRLCPRSSDTIKIEGKTIASDKWSEEFTLSENEESKEIKIEVSGEGKTSSTYVIKIVGNKGKLKEINFDYDTETIKFDENLYQVFDKDGNEIFSDGSVSDYSVTDDFYSDPEQFSVRDKKTGSLLGYVNVPMRQSAPVLSMVFNDETSYESFDSSTVWSSSKDGFKEIHICTGEQLKVEAGITYRLWKPANKDYGFASEISVTDVAERPQAPKPEAEIIKANYVKLKEIKGCEYSIAGEDQWQDNSDFYSLDVNTEYTFEVRVKGDYDDTEGETDPLYTKLHFASEAATITLTTSEGIIVPCKYRYHGQEFIEFNGFISLQEGKNEINIINDLPMLNGCVLADSQEEVITVNVSKVNGELVPDKEIVIDVEMVNYDDDGNEIPVFAEDYKYTVTYWNADDLTQMIDRQECSFSVPFQVDNDDLSIPEGYVLVDEIDPQFGFGPLLISYDGVWRAYNNKISLAVRKAEEPSTDPSTEPSTENPTAPSTDPSTEPSTENPTEPPTDTSAGGSATEPTEINNGESNKPTDAVSSTSASETQNNTNAVKDSSGSVQTGDSSMAIAVLVILISAVIAYFAYRRRI